LGPDSWVLDVAVTNMLTQRIDIQNKRFITYCSFLLEVEAASKSGIGRRIAFVTRREYEMSADFWK